jgi:hypothetical protein
MNTARILPQENVDNAKNEILKLIMTAKSYNEVIKFVHIYHELSMTPFCETYEEFKDFLPLFHSSSSGIMSWDLEERDSGVCLTYTAEYVFRGE